MIRSFCGLSWKPTDEPDGVQDYIARFLLSLFIETMQFIFGAGVAEIDDLLLNTVGVCTGAALAAAIEHNKTGTD